jgi:hypothetical protein
MTDDADLFVIPPRVSWLKIWMDGALFPAFPQDLETNLGTLEGNFTLGDTTKDNERYLSSLIVGDLTGGSLADRVRGTTAQRTQDALIEATYPNKITLPPMVDAFAAPATVTMLPGQTYVPLGTLGLLWYGAFGTALCSFNDLLHGRGSYVKVGDLGGPPANPGVIFDGKMYIPVENGYHHYDGTTLSAKLTTALARDFVSFDNQLWVLTADRKIGFSINGTTWTFPAELVIKDEIMRHIRGYLNTAGDPALVVNTEQAIWYVDPLTPTMRRTKVYWPPHPDWGRGAMVYPSGQDYYVSQGMGMIRYDGETAIQGAGLDKDAGVPGHLRGFITDMTSDWNNGWLLVQGATVGAAELETYFAEPRYRTQSPVFADQQSIPSLWKYTGTGFHRQWEGTDPTSGATKVAISTAGGVYRVVWGAGATAYHMDQRQGAYNPQEGLTLGLDRFAEEGFFELGRFYADTEGLEKIASHVMQDTKVASETETITISVETDSSPGWSPFAIVTQGGRLPARFNVDPVYRFSRGKLSEWFRLRWDFRRQSTAGMVDPEKLATERKSPLMDNAVFKFFKLAEPTTSHTLTIPIPAEPWGGRGPETIRAHLDALAGPYEFFPCVIGNRVYRGRVSQLVGSNFVGQGVKGQRQVTILDVPDGLDGLNQALIDAAAAAEAAAEGSF